MDINDIPITPAQVAAWKPESEHEKAKNEEIPDFVEKRLRMMEGALIDMERKLQGANQAYEHCWKRLRLFEELLKSWEQRFLTTEEHAYMLELIKYVRGETGNDTGR